MGRSMACQRIALLLSGCEIELGQAPKGSTVRHYFDMARLLRRDAEINWHRKGFDAEPLTGCMQFQEFARRKQRS
jgi:hypothetical protein